MNQQNGQPLRRYTIKQNYYFMRGVELERSQQTGSFAACTAPNCQPDTNPLRPCSNNYGSISKK